MYNDKNNLFSILYISDNEEEEKPKKIKKQKIINKCLNNHIKDFSRKSYKYIVNNNSNILNNKKYIELENNINKLLNNNKTNDKKPNYKNLFYKHKRITENLDYYV